MKNRKYRYFVGDFETTVYKGQEFTEVWASACAELYSDEVNVFHSIGEQFDYFVSLDANIICYYHNLKFDGTFWLSYLMIDLEYKQAANCGQYADDFKFLDVKDMPNKSFTYSISSMGQWYRIIIKVGKHIIEFRDSLKLLPFTLRQIGYSFETEHKKLEMEYTGFRYAGCKITEEEMQYIKNDVLVLKEAMEIMFQQGYKKLTIGSCCLAEYKTLLGFKTYQRYFPNVYDVELNIETHTYPNAGEWIKKSYRGGWCYLARGKENKIYRNGTTADVNSLYPSMMSSESGNRYPIGNPHFWHGNYIPMVALSSSVYYFVRIKTRFYLKPDKLPFIQIKDNLLYRATDMLETSDIYSRIDGKYHTTYKDNEGIHPARVEMTLTMTDFDLIREHYDLVDFEIIDGCYFNAAIGIFDTYIEKYKKIKLESKGAKRTLAKLFLNNLYGKMASSPASNFKVAYIKEDKSIGFYQVTANDKIPGYIPVGSAITSYARNFTIRAAQANYHGVNSPGFIYADTDSIHCDLLPDELTGIREDEKNFCCWKLESCWDSAIFARQKTYIEHITHENRERIDSPFYNVKCAGMPQRCKDLLVASMTGEKPEKIICKEEEDFINTKRNLTDFKIGLKVPGKLLPKRIRGGVLLVDTTYEMR